MRKVGDKRAFGSLVLMVLVRWFGGSFWTLDRFGQWTVLHIGRFLGIGQVLGTGRFENWAGLVLTVSDIGLATILFGLWAVLDNSRFSTWCLDQTFWVGRGLELNTEALTLKHWNTDWRT